MDHMEKLGGYTQFDFDKVREGGKNPNRFSGNGTRKHVELLPKSEGKIKETPKRKKKEESMSEPEEDWTPARKKAAPAKKEPTPDQEEKKEPKTEPNVRRTRSTRSNSSLKQ